MTPDPDRIIAGLSEGERTRIRLGRGDWRDSDWQDHCGDYDCEQCTDYIDPIGCGKLDAIGLAVRQRLQEMNDAS